MQVRYSIKDMSIMYDACILFNQNNTTSFQERNLALKVIAVGHPLLLVMVWFKILHTCDFFTFKL